MSIPTVNVNWSIVDQFGSVAIGARIEVELNRADSDGTTSIQPVRQFYTVGASGAVTFNVWPNARGVNSSQYTVRAYDRTGRRFLSAKMTVPDQAENNFLSVAQIPPFPAINQAEQAVIDAQAIASGIADFRGDLNATATTLDPGSAATATYDDALTQIQLGIPRGDVGPALGILGELADPSELPASGDLGDGYIIAGHLWTWIGTEWVDGGNIQGPEGQQGPIGETGDAGREIEVQATATHIQWRYVGDVAWTDLIPLADITGAKGDTGDTGADGSDGNNGWSPILAIVTDAERRVAQITDWIGGEGTKPATGSYIGPTGLVATPAEAVDIRGAQGETGPAGADGADGADGIGVPDSAGQPAGQVPQTDGADGYELVERFGAEDLSSTGVFGQSIAGPIVPPSPHYQLWGDPTNPASGQSSIGALGPFTHRYAASSTGNATNLDIRAAWIVSNVSFAPSDAIIGYGVDDNNYIYINLGRLSELIRVVDGVAALVDTGVPIPDVVHLLTQPIRMISSRLAGNAVVQELPGTPTRASGSNGFDIRNIAWVGFANIIRVSVYSRDLEMP